MCPRASILIVISNSKWEKREKENVNFAKFYLLLLLQFCLSQISSFATWALFLVLYCQIIPLHGPAQGIFPWPPFVIYSGKIQGGCEVKRALQKKKWERSSSQANVPFSVRREYMKCEHMHSDSIETVQHPWEGVEASRQTFFLWRPSAEGTVAALTLVHPAFGPRWSGSSAGRFFLQSCLCDFIAVTSGAGCTLRTQEISLTRLRIQSRVILDLNSNREQNRSFWDFGNQKMRY